MRLTKRCLALLRLLRVARWLTTTQIHRRYFSHATIDACRKRLRKLASRDYVRTCQRNRMTEALFTLGLEGKRILEQLDGDSVQLERRLPKQLEHFIGINDVRIAAESRLELSFFFASWQLSKLRWPHPIVPDAVFSFEGRTFAVELDRGKESVRYFVRTKTPFYRRGLAGLPLTGVLIISHSWARLDSLAQSIGDRSGRTLYTTIDAIRRDGLGAPIFRRWPEKEGLRLA